MDKKKSSLTESVTKTLLEMIVEKKMFQPGDKLPNEILLADQLGVSRTTLREAEKNLMMQNILEKRRGCGTFVAEAKTEEENSEYDNISYQKIRLGDLYQLRLIIEPQIAGLAAVKATEKEREEIWELGLKIENPNCTNEEGMEYNRQFHDAIAKATHNEIIIRIFENLNRAIVKSFPYDSTEPVNNEDMIRSHFMVAEYIRLKDSEGAAEAMRLHLKYSIKDFKIIF
ncbi:MAG: FadR/GntR family transcriptional regulator [Lachnospiraceae bacterium]|nr:FadR/GntR family transcriptional regulator [Lachnospiraceae bacterium]